MVMIPRWKKFPLKLISRWKQEFLGGKFPPFHHRNYTLLNLTLWICWFLIPPPLAVYSLRRTKWYVFWRTINERQWLTLDSYIIPVLVVCESKLQVLAQQTSQYIPSKCTRLLIAEEKILKFLSILYNFSRIALILNETEKSLQYLLSIHNYCN